MMGFRGAFPNLPTLNGGAMNWVNSVVGPYKAPNLAPTTPAPAAPAAQSFGPMPGGSGNLFMDMWNGVPGIQQRALTDPAFGVEVSKAQQLALMQGLWGPQNGFGMGMGGGYGMGGYGSMGSSPGFGGYGYGQSGDIGGLAY